ncbi:hypothetical protein M911_13855 [Ectothiorhodospira haloalkaliphila]|uniref:Uncharacterized protein n=2 Tax=Ectothiorhodospira haloalkaliphila TaxID=421628 RepID=W8KLL4_9GAMM|nr:hypothetical protein M911_13855 [Ectothiorhodospira haloalkaliphila]
MQLGASKSTPKVASFPGEVACPKAVGRQRLEAACDRHGACLESALDWYTEDCLEDMADNPDLADLAVADALQQGMIREASPPEPPPPPEREDPGPLADLPMLHGDWTFVLARVQGRSDRAELLKEYANRWLEASAAEPIPHKRDNRGRRAANIWLREETDHGRHN